MVYICFIFASDLMMFRDAITNFSILPMGKIMLYIIMLYIIFMLHVM